MRLGTTKPQGSSRLRGSKRKFCRGSSTGALGCSSLSLQDSFGVSVSLSGDTAFVGAYGDDTSASNDGAAYVFFPNGRSMEPAAALSANTALIGARQATIGVNANQGAAYVFHFGTSFGRAICADARLTVDCESVPSAWARLS